MASHSWKARDVDELLLRGGMHKHDVLLTSNTGAHTLLHCFALPECQMRACAPKPRRVWLAAALPICQEVVQ